MAEEEVDWARELFDRTRGAGEPGWIADPAVLAHAGDRRRRFRMAGAGGGLAGVVALTVAVAVGLGAGTADLGSQPGPGGAWGGRPLSNVFDYVTNMGTSEQPGDKSGIVYIPQPAAVNLAAVLGQMDPTLTHFNGSRDQAHLRIVAASDARAKTANEIIMTSVWTNDILRQSGQLTFTLSSSSGWAQTIGATVGFATDKLAAPCDIPFSGDQPVTGQSVTGASSMPLLAAQWSSCAVTRLPDGSTTGSASAKIGKGTATVALRQFADGELFSVVAQDFQTPWQESAPDPATVVQPTPWTAQSLASALADPAIHSGWSPLPPPDPDGKLLLPADLGTGWSFDTGRADQGTSGMLQAVNGCDAQGSVPLSKTGSDTHYWGPLPNGVTGTAVEGEYFLAHGSGAQDMAKVRAAAQGGCKVGPVDYSKDTVTPLPAGIGDEAFAQTMPDLGIVSVYVRVGDTILRTDLSNSNHVRDQTWTTKTPLDLSSAADQQWLAGIGRSMVSRYSGGATHH
ncbi:hypothetical protein [Catenulispora pinisilvae]|uniref:hypothetical protein n=1 Tax=Catenulispora pinisilvae TaxID=2705253 RepID=UPI001891EC97|nr:hypothetical protein [Catenulispora pinisilvae]